MIENICIGHMQMLHLSIRDTWTSVCLGICGRGQVVVLEPIPRGYPGTMIWLLSLAETWEIQGLEVWNNLPTATQVINGRDRIWIHIRAMTPQLTSGLEDATALSNSLSLLLLLGGHQTLEEPKEITSGRTFWKRLCGAQLYSCKKNKARRLVWKRHEGQSWDWKAEAPLMKNH